MGWTGARHLFVHREVRGDFSMTVSISEATGGGLSPELGLRIAGDLDPASPSAAVVVRREAAGWRLRFSRRVVPGGTPAIRVGRLFDALPVGLRIERRGSLVAVSSSVDGLSWDPLSEKEVPALPPTLLAGAAAAGDDEGADGYRPLEARLSIPGIVPLEPEVRFLRGDCNDDGAVDLSDAVYLLGYSFLGTAAPGCLAACDSNGDADVRGVSDAVYVLTYEFGGGPAPPPPFPSCGPESPDPSEALPCETPPESCAR